MERNRNHLPVKYDLTYSDWQNHFHNWLAQLGPIQWWFLGILCGASWGLLIGGMR